MKLKCGYEVLPLSEDELKETNGFNHFNISKLQPGGIRVLSIITRFGDSYFDFKFRKDDVLSMGVMKSGTTWCQEILWTLMHNPNLDNPEAVYPVEKRAPYFEHDMILTQPNNPELQPGSLYYDTFVKDFPDKDPNDGIILQTLESMQQPRIIKTHFMFSLLNPNVLDNCRVVYIARDPKDVLISLFHYFRLLKTVSYQGTLDNILDWFTAGEEKDPRFSKYWTHLKEALERKNHPNMFILYYEDLVANPVAEYSRLQSFLGLNLSEKQIEKIVQYTSFSAMKDRYGEMRAKYNTTIHNPEVEEQAGFFRKGVAGDSKKVFTEEQERKLKDWIKNNAGELGPEFRYCK